MKTHISRAILTLIATASVLSSTDAQAARVTLDGTGYYTIDTPARYYGSGVSQSGRYSNLGADFYRKTTMNMQWVTNRSDYKTNWMSLEFWGMPFYGAEAGIVLMTRTADPLRPNSYYYKKAWTGWAAFLDEFRFPEFSLWEASGRSWRFRDALSFRRSNRL